MAPESWRLDPDACYDRLGCFGDQLDQLGKYSIDSVNFFDWGIHGSLKWSSYLRHYDQILNRILCRSHCVTILSTIYIKLQFIFISRPWNGVTSPVYLSVLRPDGLMDWVGQLRLQNWVGLPLPSCNVLLDEIEIPTLERLISKFALRHLLGMLNSIFSYSIFVL